MHLSFQPTNEGWSKSILKPVCLNGSFKLPVTMKGKMSYLYVFMEEKLLSTDKAIK